LRKQFRTASDHLLDPASVDYSERFGSAAKKPLH
jgi:hypothetical protein